MRARFLALLPAGLIAGCIPASPEASSTPSPRPVASATPAPAPAPTPKPTAIAPPVEVREDFTLDGAIEQGGWLRGLAPTGAKSVRIGDQDVEIAPDGSFFAGLDRDAPSSLLLVATLKSGQTIGTTLSVAPRDWQIERVNVPRRTGGASEAFMKIRRPELAAIYGAREKRSDTDGWTQDFIWPVKGRISGRFGSQRIYQGVPGSYHSGLDIATGESGTPYVAPADGVVVLATEKPFSLEGNLLMIDHGMGLNSAFLHSSRIVVKEGDRVKRGQLLGYIGSSGRATGPHLHWSLKWQDWRLDPLLFLPPQ